ncbi:acetylxylan esterase [Dactylosporangium sp. AC04546]|uniref:acetylxylan esterase n=1 Tax=Dactylosporangium sp. AC04546 TaxID=2862460 RepID=UPI001EE08AF2|nr:acetylxylan esterase [Dactylosporangium sp. AC04546]WVK82874.1 acetylxylan esterase [Dactylosporangium sp. AC04546]
MALFDLPLDRLRTYRSASNEPADFDEFWATTLDEARTRATPAVLTEVDAGLRSLHTIDVTFSGYGGQPVKAWLIRPRNVDGPLPVMVEFIGYGGGRGFPHDFLLWSAAGYASLVMDTRGQGGRWRAGDTPDPDGSGPQAPGFLTRGVLDPRTFYYRRLVTDAVRAVETARALPFASKVLVTGISQGGGLALAAGGLSGDAVSGVISGVPFLCDIRRAVTITDNDPYAEFARFVRLNPARAEAALSTVDYVDGVHFAKRITAPALVSAALMDLTCPPSTVFAAYNAIPGRKEMQLYEWDGHDGGQGHFSQRSVQFANSL